MRIFFAFEIPDKIKSQISARLLSQKIKNIRFIDKDNFHLTFEFLGEIKKEDLPKIFNFVEGNFQDVSQFVISNPKLEVVPINSPRIIWISFSSEAKQKIEIKKILMDKFLQSLGYKIKTRPYKFHLTLSRIKKEIGFENIEEIKRIKFDFDSLKIEKLTCFESILSAKGATYRSIKSFKLNKIGAING